MKRTFIVSIFCLASLASYGQVKLGLRFAPTINVNRVFSLSDTLQISQQKSSFQMVLGLFSDIPFTDTYSISTGINFAPKRINLSFDGEVDGTYTEQYRMQYLQIPVLLKLFTDDMQPGLRAYFQVGPLIEVNIFNSPLNNDFDFIQKFRPVDASISIGAGLEKELGISTVAFGGFNYSRGMVNVVSASKTLDDANPMVKNDFFQIELGLKF